MLPQVFARFIGFATYQFDSNLRNSTMVGIVGAGGVGGTLFSAFQRFDYDFVSAILLTLIAIIMLGEILAGFVRAVFLDNLGFDRILQGRFAGARPGLGPGVEYGIEHARRNRRDAQGGGGRMNAHATLRNAGAPREWHRYSLGQRLLRFALYLLLALAIGQAMRGVEIIPEFLYDAPEQMADLFRRMWPVDWAYPGGVHAALVETLHIATLGTILSVIWRCLSGCWRRTTSRPAGSSTCWRG